MGTSIEQSAILTFIEEGLATNCRQSDDLPDLRAPEALLKRLEQEADDQVRQIFSLCGSLKTASGNLVPILQAVHSLLCKHGKLRRTLERANLPTWEEWWEAFKKKHGIRASLRTVQRHLAQRALPPPEPKPKSLGTAASKARLSKPEQKNMKVNDLGVGVVAEDEQPPASIPEHQIPSGFAYSEAQPEPFSRSIKRGDWSGTSLIISDRCGAEIYSCLHGLDPDLMAECAGQLFNAVFKSICVAPRGGGGFRISVEHIAAKVWAPSVA